MKVAIDHSPIADKDKTSHKIRGTGFYTKHLISALLKYHPENEYILFTSGEKMRGKADVFHYPYFEPFFLSLPLRKLGKTIITVHDVTPLVFPQDFPVGVKGKIKLQLQKKVIKRMDAIITDSESSKKDIERILRIPKNKVFSIPLAAADEYKKITISKTEKEELLKKYDLPEKFILYVGDATPNKNLKRLVTASRELDIPLAMVGGALTKKVDRDHPWNKDLIYVQDEAQRNPLIHLLGFVSDEDLVKLYNVTTVFVFLSYYEGFGLPVLEAAACGTPIVTTKLGSIPEVIGSAALFVDPYDLISIKSAIKQVFMNKALQEELSKKALIQAKKFSWEKTADMTVKIYEEVCKKT